MNSFRNNNFFFYIAGRLVSQIGSSAQMIALPLYILDTTGSGFITGIFAMLSMAPALIASPLAGVLGDRFCRRKIMIYSDFARSIMVCLLAFTAFRNSLTIPILFFIQIFLSVLDSMFDSSSDGILPELVIQDNLSKGNAAKGAVDSFSMIIGPVLSGIVYGIWGIAMVFVINAVSFILSSLLGVMIVYKKERFDKGRLTVRVFVNEIREVLQFISTNRGLKQLFTFAMVINFLLVPIFIVVMPFAFKKVIGFSSQQYGFLQTFSMIGLLAGNIGVGVFFNKLAHKKMMKAGMLLQTVALIAFSILMLPYAGKLFNSPGWTYFAAIGLSIIAIGVVNPLVNIPIQTNLQKLVKDEMRSRFFSVLNLMTQLMIPAGSFIFGTLLDIVPVYVMLTGITSLVILAAVLFISTASDEVYKPAMAEVQEV